MRRGYHEMVAEALWEAKTKRIAKTRIAARCSINNNFMEHLINAGLLTEGPPATITDKGNEFLIHFQALAKLCPKPQRPPQAKEEIAFKLG
jgi:predicted transcriptional regulator